MKFERDFIRAAALGSQAEIAAIWPVLVKCAKSGARKAGLSHGETDDIAQELWMFFKDNYERLDDEYNIEPFLTKTAWNIGMAHKRKFSSYGTGAGHGLGDDDSLSSERIQESYYIDQDAYAEPIDDASLDAERAMRALLLRSPALRVAARNEIKAPRSTANQMDAEADERDTEATSEVRATTRPWRALSADNIELRAIRERLGVTQARMASMVGAKLCTYQVYEYGKSSKVPDRIMSAARDLVAHERHDADNGGAGQSHAGYDDLFINAAEAEKDAASSDHESGMDQHEHLGLIAGL